MKLHLISLDHDQTCGNCTFGRRQAPGWSLEATLTGSLAKPHKSLPRSSAIQEKLVENQVPSQVAES